MPPVDNGERSISMELINKQTYKSACISNQIVYSDESNYKDICKELRSNTDTNFVLITHCEHDNIIEPINMPRNITKWFVSDLNLEHHKKESIPRGIENGPVGRVLPQVAHRNIGIFDDETEEKQKIMSTIQKSIPCLPITKHKTTLSYVGLASFMVSTVEVETYTILIANGISIVNNKKICDMYHDAPVLFVEKWEDINKSILHQTKAVFKNKPFQMNTLTPEYWRQKIWKAAEH